MQIKRDANWVPLPMDQQPILDMKIDGFSPVIINVTSINVPALLGLNVCEEEDGACDSSSDLSFHSTLPMDRVDRLEVI